MDTHAARVIAEAATTPAGGAVLEIGAGLGALTRPLLDRAARVVAIERDRDLAPLLRSDLDDAVGENRLRVIEGDALEIDWLAEIEEGPRPHAIAGNLPYLVTGPLIERATGMAERLDRVVFMVQAEVADRLAARPATAAYGALSVFVQAAFTVERLITVRAGAFYPRPGVDSAVVTLTPCSPRRASETTAFREAVKAAFGTRRKTLRNAWRGLYGWSREKLEESARDAGISLDARGETLTVEQFAAMARAREAESPLEQLRQPDEDEASDQHGAHRLDEHEATRQGRHLG
jgi:16S rRNA (adenine1518-N6/adenine1519-N6)-dimethyltransferase